MEHKEEIEYEEETPEVEVELEETIDEEEMETNAKNKKDSYETPNLPDKLEKIHDEKIRGRIIIFNSKESEFAKNLNISKIGDYVEKVKWTYWNKKIIN